MSPFVMIGSWKGVMYNPGKCMRIIKQKFTIHTLHFPLILSWFNRPIVILKSTKLCLSTQVTNCGKVTRWETGLNRRLIGWFESCLPLCSSHYYFAISRIPLRKRYSDLQLINWQFYLENRPTRPLCQTWSRFGLGLMHHPMMHCELLNIVIEVLKYI